VLDAGVEFALRSSLKSGHGFSAGASIAEELMEIFDEADDDDRRRADQSRKEKKGEHFGGNSDDPVHNLIVSREKRQMGAGSGRAKCDGNEEVAGGEEFLV
jgi:hypothetical protein